MISSLKLFVCFFALLFISQACNNGQVAVETKPKPVDTVTADECNRSKGYWDNGKIVDEFYCPDAIGFAPIDLKEWYKTPAVNGRLPTYAETQNGTAILHYGEVVSAFVWPYDIKLPKLAKWYDFHLDKDVIVVVIQATQTPEDTIMGFRFLTGGCGGSPFRDIHFLSNKEVNEIGEK